MEEVKKELQALDTRITHLEAMIASRNKIKKIRLWVMIPVSILILSASFILLYNYYHIFIDLFN